MEYICEICGAKFTCRGSLKHHTKTCDGRDKSKIRCSECYLTFFSMKSLRSHIAEIHNVKLEKEEILFLSFQDFQIWKTKIEKEGLCFYSLRSTAVTSRGKHSRLLCHRSGYFKSRSKGVRPMKSQGSNKMNSTCPSSMNVIEDSLCVRVTFHKTHFGHGSNVRRCPLIENKKSAILDKVPEKISLPSEISPLEKPICLSKDNEEKKHLHDTIVQSCKAIMESLSEVRQKLSIDDYTQITKYFDSALDIIHRDQQNDPMLSSA